MSKSILRDKSYAFAVDAVKLCRSIQNVNREFILTQQLLRSATAIGALVHEAEFAQSAPDFISKLSIALKEANETKYWLRLSTDSGLISNGDSLDHQQKCQEIIALLVSIIKTLKEKQRNYHPRASDS